MHWRLLSASQWRLANADKQHDDKHSTSVLAVEQMTTRLQKIFSRSSPKETKNQKSVRTTVCLAEKAEGSGVLDGQLVAIRAIAFRHAPQLGVASANLRRK